ncbi:MAG: cellulase family glycosylhydrolase, partial [Candidatus Latescibacterota bacterium]|nr:cellulase family glycosylhydrolase [Candidatus Latescibacterota bacterium]
IERELVYKVIVLVLCLVVEGWSEGAPFRRGVNLTGWLQVGSARQVQFTRFGREDLVQIQGLGCDVVRLPINLHAMVGEAPDYRVDPLLFFFLDQIVDWADELGLHLILDNHSFDPAGSTSVEIGQVLVPVWRQVAGHFADHPARLYYEVLNEPHGIVAATWNEIQGQVIVAIRSVDRRHAIVVGPAEWNSYRNLQRMPVYADDNLVYTFHFYDPFVFTHQGASWVTPSMVPLGGVPFPFDAARMPQVPAELVGSWVGGALGSYGREGTIAKVQELVDIAAAFKEQRGVPLFCGEFGTYIPNSDNGDRVFWYETVRRLLEQRGIAWTIWDYRGGFGLFERGTSELFDFDLNGSLLEALGLVVPPQREFVLEPEREGFALYGDFIGPAIAESSAAGSGQIDYYSEEDPAVGRYCLRWTGVGQYDYVGFDFRPIKDLSVLAADYAVEFWVRGDSPGTSFDMRLVDTDAQNPEDHPWRMRFRVDEDLASWDGEWHKLRIPLGDFAEHGAWENGWFNPIGAFDWRAIDRFDIVAEDRDLAGITFWFDDMHIAGPATTRALFGDEPLPQVASLRPNYPNPFNAATTIRYELPAAGPVQIAIYDMAGQRVRNLVDGIGVAGRHIAQWNGVDGEGRSVASGVYLYRMATADFVAMGKMTLLR